MGRLRVYEVRCFLMNAVDGSVIVADGSASINAEDEVAAFDAAQTKLQETVAGDTVLLANAQQRAQSLLEDYVTNVGNLVGKEYIIRWIYLDENGDKTGETVTSQPESDEASEVEADSSGE